MVIVLFALLFSCATAQPDQSLGDIAPEEGLISGDMYPEAEYLTAVGSGDTRRAAEEDAVGNLARIFGSEVAVDTRIVDTYRSLAADDTEYTEREMELVDNIHVQARQELINVRFSEPVSDPSGLVSIIAYLNRDETGSIYADLIRANNKRIESFRESAESADSLMTAYARLNAAHVIAVVNERLGGQLQIIAPEMISPSGASLEDIERERQSLQSEMVFRVDVEGDDDGQIAAFIGEGISRLGFSTADDGLLAVQGSLQLTMSSGRYETVIWNIVLNIVNEAGSIIATVEETNREQAAEANMARMLALRTVKTVVDTDLMSQLFANLTDQRLNSTGEVLGDG
ncbi:MAG: hypothetical protein ACR2PY_07005 [Salinispira sp.]